MYADRLVWRFFDRMLQSATVALSACHGVHVYTCDRFVWSLRLRHHVTYPHCLTLTVCVSVTIRSRLSTYFVRAPRRQRFIHLFILFSANNTWLLMNARPGAALECKVTDWLVNQCGRAVLIGRHGGAQKSASMHSIHQIDLKISHFRYKWFSTLFTFGHTPCLHHMLLSPNSPSYTNTSYYDLFSKLFIHSTWFFKSKYRIYIHIFHPIISINVFDQNQIAFPSSHIPFYTYVLHKQMLVSLFISYYEPLVTTLWIYLNLKNKL